MFSYLLYLLQNCYICYVCYYNIATRFVKVFFDYNTFNIRFIFIICYILLHSFFYIDKIYHPNYTKDISIIVIIIIIKRRTYGRFKI